MRLQATTFGGQTACREAKQGEQIGINLTYLPLRFTSRFWFSLTRSRLSIKGPRQ